MMLVIIKEKILILSYYKLGARKCNAKNDCYDNKKSFEKFTKASPIRIIGRIVVS